MIKKLKDVPKYSGSINGTDYEANITVRITTNGKLRDEVMEMIDKGVIKTLSLDKTYHVHKITSYGYPFDVWVTNDLGKEEEFGEWIFEDIN